MPGKREAAVPEALSSSKANLIEVHGLTHVHGTGPAAVKALDHLDLSIRRGGFVAVVGVSGSGKSTLLHLLGCLDTPTAGSIRVDGHELGSLSPLARAQYRRTVVGFV